MENAKKQENSDPDQDLLIEEASLDSAAFAQLYRLHYDRIFRYCARRLFNRHTAEDVTSTVFFKAMRTISSFKGNSTDFRNWLYRIATNLVRSAQRRQTRWRVVHSLISSNGHHAHEPKQQSNILRDEIGVRLRRAVADLPLRYRIPLVLYEVDEWPYRRIAEFLDCREGTVKSRIHRGRNMIREQLQPYVNGGLS